MTIEEVLDQREKTYGVFKEHAEIAQNIKRAMRNSFNWKLLTSDKKEALEMIAHKIARVLNGDSHYIENYRDIAGYAILVVNNLKEAEGATDSRSVYMRVVEGKMIDVS